MKKLIIPLLILVSLTGCAGKVLKDPASKNVSMVFAYINTDEFHERSHGGNLYDVKAKENGPGLFYMYDLKGGSDRSIVYSVDVEAGVYSLNDLRIVTGNITNHLLLHNHGIDEGKVNVGKQGVYFLGSYKYEKTKDGFAIVRTSTPSEKEVIKKILSHRYTEEGQWKKMLKSRMKKLR